MSSDFTRLTERSGTIEPALETCTLNYDIAVLSANVRQQKSSQNVFNVYSSPLFDLVVALRSIIH